MEVNGLRTLGCRLYSSVPPVGCTLEFEVK